MIATKAKKPGNRSGKAQFRTLPQGYEAWRSWNKDGEELMYVHRLLAISEFGVEEVAGNHVHHKNKIPWDNRPENIEVKNEKQHLGDHTPNGVVTQFDKIKMYILRNESGASYKILGEHFGRAQSTVYNAVKEIENGAMLNND